MDLPSEDADHKLGYEEVTEDDEDRGDNDRLCGGAAHATCSAGGGETVIAANTGDDEAGEKRFGEAFDNVTVGQRHVGGVEEGWAVKVQERDRDEGAPGGAHSVRDDGEEEEHEDRRHNARGDELADGIGAEGAHGIDLLGDLHGSEFGGHTGGVAAGDHEAGENGAELFDHGECDEATGHADGAKLLKRDGGL